MFPPGPIPPEDPGMMPPPGLAPEPPPLDEITQEVLARMTAGRLSDRVDYNVKISDDARVDLGRKLLREEARYADRVERRRKNAEEWRMSAEMMPLDDREVLVASGLRAPFTALAVAEHERRLNQATFVRPPFTSLPKNAEAESACAKQEIAIPALLEEAGWEQVMRALHAETPLLPDNLVRLTWETITRKVPRHPVSTDLEQAGQLIALGVHPAEAIEAATETDRDGLPVPKLEWETITVKDGFSLKLIPYFDAIILPASAKCDEDVWAYGERLTIRGADLRKGIKDGTYDREITEQILSRRSDEEDPEEAERRDVSGTDGGDGTLGTEEFGESHRSYKMIEVVMLADLDEDDEEELYIVTVHRASGLVPRVQYFPYEHGLFPYVRYGYRPRVGQITTQGVAERVENLQDMGSHLLNLMADLARYMASAKGALIIRKGAIRMEEFTLDIGVPIEIDDLSAIRERPLATGVSEAINALMTVYQSLKEQSDLLSATSNVSLGRETSGDKTAYEVSQVKSSADQIFEDSAAGKALGDKKFFTLARLTAAERAPGGKVDFRIPAAEGETMLDPATGQMIPAAKVGDQLLPAPGGYHYGSITREELLADVEIIPAGAAGFADSRTRAQRSVLALQQVLASPVGAQSLELIAAMTAQVIRDLGVPQAESYAQMIYKTLGDLQAQQLAQQQAMALQQAAAVQQLQGGAMDQEAKAAEQARAREKAPIEDMQGLVGVAGQLQQLGAGTNGGAKPKAGARR